MNGEKETGLNFIGKCVSCKNEGEVRYLKQYPRLDDFYQKAEKIGPYDRFCAYKLKFPDVPIFFSQPKGWIETFYRLFTQLEIPYDKNRKKEMILETLKAIRIYIISYLMLFPIFLGFQLIFLAIIVPMSPIMIIVYPLMFVLMLMRPIRMITKYAGFTKTQNFEKFWEGKINKQDKHINFLIRLVITYSPLVIIFRIILNLSYIFNPTGFFGILLFPPPLYTVKLLSFLHVNPVKLVATIITFMLIFHIYVLRELCPWDRYTAIPKDIHIIGLERKREVQIQTQNVEKIDYSPRKRSINPFALISGLISESSRDLDFLCQICKDEVKETEREVYCNNCIRYYHVGHIVTYLRDLEGENKVASCPVCYSDAEVVFSEINWKLN